jgi:hypothetical protein
VTRLLLDGVDHGLDPFPDDDGLDLDHRSLGRSSSKVSRRRVAPVREADSWRGSRGNREVPPEARTRFLRRIAPSL